MGEEDNEALSEEDTIILTAEDMDQILQEVPEDEKPNEEK